MKSFAAIAAACVLLALTTLFAPTASARPRSTPTPAPTPTPIADPAVTKLVRQQFVAWQAGSVDKSAYATSLQPKLTDEEIASVSGALAQLGALVDTVYLGPLLERNAPADARGYLYQMRCSEGNVYALMVVDADGKIGSILFKNRIDTETVTVPGASPPPR